MPEVVGGARSGGWAELRSVRWRSLGSRALWLAVAFSVGGALVGPLTNVVVRRLIPPGGEGWGGVVVQAGIGGTVVVH